MRPARAPAQKLAGTGFPDSFGCAFVSLQLHFHKILTPIYKLYTNAANIGIIGVIIGKLALSSRGDDGGYQIAQFFRLLFDQMFVRRQILQKFL